MNMRGQRVLLESGARTATTACLQQNAAAASSVRLYLVVTAASGTGGLTLQLRGYDKASGASAVVMLAPAAVTAAGVYVYELLAGSSSGAEGNVVHSVSRPLPVVWDINVVHADGSSYTYSVSAEQI